MKKILSTLIVFVLLFSAIGVAFNIAPKAKSAGTWHLAIFTSPSEVSTYYTIFGTGDYPEDWNGPITTEFQVLHNVSGYWNTAWNFNHWEQNGTNQGSGLMFSCPDGLDPAAGDYINLTAVYDTYYYLKVNSPYGLPTTGEGWKTAGTTAYAGLTSGYEWVMYGVQWYFDHWSGDASGSNSAASDGILMNSGKTANALWYVQYYLEYHSPEYMGNTYWHNWPGYDGWSWYNNSLVVPLNAPAMAESGGGWQMRFDHWNKNGIFYSSNPSITVTISGAPVNMTAYYQEWDLITFNDNIGDLSGVSALTGYYKAGTTQPFSPPAGTPIPDGTGMQLRWAWWDQDALFYSSSMAINYYVWGPHTLTARYQQQYKATLATYPAIPATVEIGASILGTAPINGWFDAGSTVYFWVPDVAILVPGNYKWIFDTSPNGQWWQNGVFWGSGLPPNATGWREAWYVNLNQPLDIVVNYTKYYYLQWDTDPTGLSGPSPAWSGFNWFPAGSDVVWSPQPPGWYIPVWAFKEIIDNGVSQGVGVSNYHLDGGSLSQAHNVKAHYVNATSFYIIPATTILTAPKYCTTFDETVVAANFDASRGMDLYAVDFKIYYNSTLIKLYAADYAPYLDAMWGQGKWFVAKNMSYVYYDGLGVCWDVYWFAATALQGAHGFEGNAPIVKLTFHVELDPCYPKTYWSPIGWMSYVLTNSTGYPLYPELAYGANYYDSAPQPIVEIDVTNMPIRKNVPQQTFDAYVNIKLGIKVKDFHIEITYPSCYIEPINVTFGDYLPGPAFLNRGFTLDKAHDRIYVWAEEDPTGSPLANGNGTLFIVEFKVKCAVFWNNPSLGGMIAFDKTTSYLSVCCPFPMIQHFNPDILTYDAAYSYVPLPGDLNFDGIVDLSDLKLLAMTYWPGWPVPPGWPYDVNLDGTVNILDLVLVAMHYHDHI